METSHTSRLQVVEVGSSTGCSRPLRMQLCSTKDQPARSMLLAGKIMQHQETQPETETETETGETKLRTERSEVDLMADRSPKLRLQLGEQKLPRSTHYNHSLVQSKSVIRIMSYCTMQSSGLRQLFASTSQVLATSTSSIEAATQIKHCPHRPRRSSLLAPLALMVLLTIWPAFYTGSHSSSITRTTNAVEAVGVAPTIDYSHNMRVLKLPKSTKSGEIIYRLRGSDGDPNSQLHFGLASISGRALLEITQVPGSWNEADVYLRAKLEHSELESNELAAGLIPLGDPLGNPLYAAIYNLTIYVADASNLTTQLDSTILITNDELDDDPDETSAPAESLSNYEAASTGDSEQRKYATISGGSTSSGHFAHHLSGNSSLLKLPTLGSMARVNSRQLTPFIRPRHVFNVPENGQPGESIGFLQVRESDKSDLPVRFELRGRGADHFGIRYVFGPRGQSRAELVLSQPVDYEKQNLFQLKVLALNAWTNVKYDTRNVATLDIVITVNDVQDSAPQFKRLPHALRLTNAMRPGDLVGRVEAEDGDYADQRPIGYALDAGSPLSNYFTIDKQSGEIRLVRSSQELTLNQQNLAFGAAGSGGGANGNPSGGISSFPTSSDLASGSVLQLTVFASELPDASSYDHLWPPMFARAEIPLTVVDLVNEAPQFVGGWLSETSGGANGMTMPTLRAFVREFASSIETGGSRLDEPGAGGSLGQLVQWYVNKNYTLTGDHHGTTSQESPNAAVQQQLLRATRGRPMVIDLNQGLNGTFQLTLEGPDAHLFELEPNYPISRQTLFNLFVSPEANRSLFDFDTIARPSQSEPPVRSFHVELVARDFGQPHRLATRLKCLIDLVDVNDNAPQFDQGLYTFSIFENAQLGQILGSIRARDLDRLAGTSGVLSGQQQRVRYTSLTGRDSHLFRLDQESGLITLEGQLDREKQDHYLLLAEARDLSGLASNYTKILVNVLDVNDNAPVFSQSHYDAVLLADGTFYQPLVVSATDGDEPSSANSQVAYEIIAGNQNDQFAIDSLSGAIYLTGSANDANAPAPPARPLQMPSILSEPILPFINPSARDHRHDHGSPKRQPDQHGKILPSPSGGGGGVGGGSQHEVEETTLPSLGRGQNQRQPSSPLRLNWPRSVQASGSGGEAHNLQDLMQQETIARRQTNGAATSAAQPAGQPQVAQAQRGVYPERDFQNQPTPGGPSDSAHPQQQHFDASKVAPVTTLVVRAHDFGIPLRSATCKVNIYNQALVSRPLSIILNGTAEQLEARRELIERSFGALTGSRAQIESIDALSDSSSISVARVRLAMPAGHSLVDLTDLSALMTAIDYKQAGQANGCALNQQHQHQNLDQFKHPVHYITTGDRIYPVHHGPISGNISATSSSGTGSAPGTTTIFTDIQSLDHASNMLERKLLFYIIIVGICILALLVIWMLYFCCREDQQQQQQHRESRAKRDSSKTNWRRNRKAMESLDASELSAETATAATNTTSKAKGRHYKSKSSSRTHLIDEQQTMAKSASQLNLRQDEQQDTANKTTAKTTIGQQHPVGNNLLKQQQQQQQNHQLSIPSNIKPEHYSMYNGQVWFEQGGLVRAAQQQGSRRGIAEGGQRAQLGERRASSAPSAGGHSLDSGLPAIINGRASALSPANSGLATPQRGHFFPNTLGYAENLATMAAPAGAAFIYPTSGAQHQRQLLNRRTLVRSNRGRVMPMSMVPAAGDCSNDAFEPDLEAGGLVMMPFGGTGPSRHRRHHHHHHHNHSKGRHRKSKGTSSTSSSSASHSDSTRTLDEEDELNHESVLLDSDQELLGFDSTGTPIIATRTRHRPGDNDSSLLMAPGNGQLPLNGGGPTTGSSSPAATVINMGQIKPSAARVATDASGKTATGAAEQVAVSTAANGSTTSRKATSDAKEAGKVVGEKLATDQTLKRQNGAEKLRESATSNTIKVADTATATTTTKREEQTKKAETDPPAQTSVDLMSELNKRLNSANKQRALRRQSAGDDQQQTDESGAGEKLKQVSDRQQRQPPMAEAKDESANKAPKLGAIGVAPSGGDGEKPATTSDDTKPPAASGVDKQQAPNGQAATLTKRRTSETMSYQSQSTISDGTTTTAHDQDDHRLRDMKNGELLEKQSIFALTYSGLATDKLPG